MNQSVQSWACAELSKLGHPNTDEIISYLFEIDDEAFMEEYLNAMLDISDPNHKNFMKDFMQRSAEVKSSLGPGFYRKPDIETETKSTKYDATKTKEKSKEKEKCQPNISLGNLPASQVAAGQFSTKKKAKYIALYSEEGQKKDVILLPGRHKCDCQASKHKLINNCLKCGRIVCEQEGSGPCAFCHNLVVSREEKDVISRGTKKSEALHNKLIHSKKIVDKENGQKEVSKSLQKAIDHKNKLLEYDQTSEKRTKVFDDESDYFQTSSKWINPDDKKKLQKHEEMLKQKKYDKSNKKFTIDILGRKVTTEQEQSIYDPDDPVLKEILESSQQDIYSYGKNEELISKYNVERPLYICSVESERHTASDYKSNAITTDGLYKIQDRELQEMRDDGMCLSMHQPWASLLIAGIKVHEGRTWYSSHRGRLWIASAAKVPSQSDISLLEQQYRILLKEDNLIFPQHYPAGCLLGCVDVLDMLPQEEYRAQYPEGESDSPYVFICENPQEMIIKFPVKGQHKIFKLDSKIHLAAKKSIR